MQQDIPKFYETPVCHLCSLALGFFDDLYFAEGTPRTFQLVPRSSLFVLSSLTNPSTV